MFSDHGLSHLSHCVRPRPCRWKRWLHCPCCQRSRWATRWYWVHEPTGRQAIGNAGVARSPSHREASCDLAVVLRSPSQAYAYDPARLVGVFRPMQAQTTRPATHRPEGGKVVGCSWLSCLSRVQRLLMPLPAVPEREPLMLRVWVWMRAWTLAWVWLISGRLTPWVEARS